MAAVAADRKVVREAMEYIKVYQSENFPRGIAEAGLGFHQLSDDRKIVRAIGNHIDDSGGTLELSTTKGYISDKELKPFVERLLNEGQEFILTTGHSDLTLSVKFSIS